MVQDPFPIRNKLDLEVNMDMLQVYLFGSIQVRHDYGTRPVKLTPSVQNLLAYLLLERQRTHPRETLAGLFWGDNTQERARNCLNTALWRLRSALEPDGVPPGTYLVNNHQGDVGFNVQSDYWLDVADFEDETRRWLSRPAHSIQAGEIPAIENSLKLYRGDLLEGLYEDWVLRERERLRFQFLNSLAFLMRCCKLKGDFEKSIVYGHQILGLDPLREEIHRELMRLYMENGQRALAVRQYENCRQVMAEELGILPLEETRILYDRILFEGNELVAGPPPNQLADLNKTLCQLHQTDLVLENAQTELRQAMKLVENLMSRPARTSIVR